MDDVERLVDAGRLVAELDQVGAALEDVAGVLGKYYEQLIDAGIPPEHAVDLVCDVQRLAIFGRLGPELD